MTKAPECHIQWSQILYQIFADDVFLLTSLSNNLQVAVGGFEAECEATAMKISTFKSEAMVLSCKRVAWPHLAKLKEQIV